MKRKFRHFNYESYIMNKNKRFLKEDLDDVKLYGIQITSLMTNSTFLIAGTDAQFIEDEEDEIISRFLYAVGIQEDSYESFDENEFEYYFNDFMNYLDKNNLVYASSEAYAVNENELNFNIHGNIIGVYINNNDSNIEKGYYDVEVLDNYSERF